MLEKPPFSALLRSITCSLTLSRVCAHIILFKEIIIDTNYLKNNNYYLKEDNDLIDTLYKMIRDQDPLVV